MLRELYLNIKKVKQNHFVSPFRKDNDIKERTLGVFFPSSGALGFFSWSYPCTLGYTWRETAEQQSQTKSFQKTVPFKWHPKIADSADKTTLYHTVFRDYEPNWKKQILSQVAEGLLLLIIKKIICYFLLLLGLRAFQRGWGRV